MPRRIAVNSLNASTVDIINTIRANASYEYQQLVPEITDATEIPKVGEVLYGYPALANQFINALVNRIALVRVKSAVFNNAYAELKKGYLEFGETVEEVFVNICKAREFSAEKAEARELKRSLPDVRTAFHAMNWRVQYPVTIQDEDLRMAFTSAQGVQDLIAKIIDAVTTAAEYDEFLLFKYLIIKAVAHGKMYPIAISGADIKDFGKKARGVSNLLTFMSDKYNADGVHTTTPKNDQYIFMDAMFNAEYDVEVLASAFNMDKAEYQGQLKLVDDFGTFDNERFEAIRANSDMIEEVTADELALCANIKAVLVDREWFQIYDNQNKFTEKYVASGEYWNYFYNVWKTVSSSPFSNAVVLIEDNISSLDEITVEVTGKEVSEAGTVFTLMVNDEEPNPNNSNARFVQTEQATQAGIAVHPYGAVIFAPNSANYELTVQIGDGWYEYTGETEGGGQLNPVSTAVGATFTLNKLS